MDFPSILWLFPLHHFIWLGLESAYRKTQPHQTKVFESRTWVVPTTSACGLAVRKPHYLMGCGRGFFLSAPPLIPPQASRGWKCTFHLWTWVPSASRRHGMGPAQVSLCKSWPWMAGTGRTHALSGIFWLDHLIPGAKQSRGREWKRWSLLECSPHFLKG